MSALGLPEDDPRVVTLRLGLARAEVWLAAGKRDGFSRDLAGWIRHVVERHLIG